MSTDPLSVAREALQAITDTIAYYFTSGTLQAIDAHAATALVALEAAEAARTKRDDEIREAADAISLATVPTGYRYEPSLEWVDDIHARANVILASVAKEGTP